MLPGEPVTGVGPDGRTWAWWTREDGTAVLSVHLPGGQVDGTWERPGAQQPRAAGVRYVQPLPGGRVLLVGAATGEGMYWAQVQTLDGVVLTAGTVGRDARHVETTSDGHVWVGYGDTAATGGDGPGRTGLACFDDALRMLWQYAPPTPEAHILSVYALNVTDTVVHHCSFGDFHLIAIPTHAAHTGAAHTGAARDLGLLDRRGARHLLIQDQHGALIGGWEAAYDLITGFTLNDDGVRLHGQQHRLVLPDGLEIRGARGTSRGARLHLHLREHWYAIDLHDLSP